MQTLIIQNALLCDHLGERKSDLKITQGQITQISPHIQSSGEKENIIDASNCILIPACIDLNIQAKACTQKDLNALEKKAIKGGVGTIILNENIDFLNLFNLQSPMTFLAHQTAYTHQVQELSQMHHDGALAYIIGSSTPSEAMKCIYEYAKLHTKPCICRLENPLGGVCVSSEMSFKLGLSQTLPFIQELEFARFFSFAHHYQIPTLLSALSEERILNQTQAHPHIKNEVSIHHLILNEEQINSYYSWAKLTPPLCTKQVQESLKNQIAKIDMLTSLHREISANDKEQTFDEAKSGVDCLEFYFPLLFTELVQTHLLSLQDLCAKTSFHQAQFLGINQGEISLGKEASLILFDPKESFDISHPLYGERKLFGKIKAFISPKIGLCEEI